MAFTILQSDFVVYGLLPFMLVFVVVFAALQKSKILGDGKKQIDALVALAIGLIVVSFGYAVDIIVPLAAFLAVAAVIILVFMLLLGMTGTGQLDLTANNKVKMGMVILIAVAVIAAVVVFTGAGSYFLDLISANADSNLFGNVVFILIIVGIIVFVLSFKDKPAGSGGSSGGH